MRPKTLRRDITGSFIGILFLALIPLSALIPPASNWLAQDLVARWVSALLFLFCLSRFFREAKDRAPLELDFLNLSVLALTAWILLSVKNSREAFESFYAFRNFAAMVLLWFSLRMIWDRDSALYAWFEKVFFWTSVAAAGWICVTTLGHASSIVFFQEIVPRRGFFFNENVAAGFLGMALVWAVLKRLHLKPVPFWSIGLFFLGWTLTQSRGSFVAMLAVVTLYLLIHMREFEGRLRAWKKFQWVWFTLAVVVFLFCISFTLHKLFSPQEVDSRASNRLGLWNSCLRMALDQPLLGFGPGTFQDAFASYKSASIWNTFVPAAHNEFLQVAVECGWPALLLLSLLLWAVLRETGSRLFQTPAFKAAAPGALVSESVFFLVLLEAVHNCVDFTFHDWSHRLLLIGFVAYALKEKTAADDVRTTLYFSRRALWGGAGFLVLAVVWIMGVGAFRDFWAQVDAFQGTLAYKQNRLDEAEAFANASLRLRVDFMKPWNLLGAVADVRGERASGAAERKKYFQGAEEYYGKAAQLAPYSLEPLENKVHFLVVQRRLSEALELQNLLVDLAPRNPIEQIQRAQILLAMGRAQESIVSAQKAVDLDDYFIPGYLAKAQAMEALGKRADAILIYRNIEEIIKQQNIPELEARLSQVEADIRRLQAKP